MQNSPLKSKEPIAGYAVKERIGAGGYGEVWRAEAPGGLVKAVKFVYGCLDEVRASAEMKALNRIKEVRHPFLLSLERIEIVDGQLVIVTELADGSLKERYQECVDDDESLPGIPRDELLMYLGDAADALDYMNVKFSLQHLDVKPENLLLVGGRVKVADFGLVKDIHDYTASLMSGLTPVYASPEVFDGRPGHYSDQYSLAIVYQELLTGELPFDGRSAAQLAAQHLNAQPNLEPLPPGDREVVVRALCKDPKQRFESCRQFIDDLIEAGRKKRPAPSSEPAPPLSGPEVDAAPLLHHPPKTDSATRVQAVTPLANSPPVIRDLPPLKEPGQTAPRPTLFVGVGGLAAKTLKRLHRRLHDRFETLAHVPCWRMLLMDTDRKALLAATQGDEKLTLDPGQTMALPLRRTQDYRRDSKKFLQWLSRRWLYNIPRSLQTEGLRPLGRLAFVDHAEAVFQRLRDELAHITSDEAAEVAAKTLGMSIEVQTPRIVVVASVCGGTGGGMVLDLAYAARKVLAESGVQSEDIRGVLLFATERKPSARELAMVNAFACLGELHHYTRREAGFPGDTACGLPSTESATFSDACLLNLGECLAEEEFDLAADQVAEYLYRQTATAAGKWMDACREVDADPVKPDVSVRSVGLRQVGCSQSELAQRAAELLCRTVVDRWCGDGETLHRNPLAPDAVANRQPPPQVLDGANMDDLAAQCCTAMELQFESLDRRIEQMAEAALGKKQHEFVHQLLLQFHAKAELLYAHEAEGRSGGVLLMQMIDEVLGPRLDDNEPDGGETSWQRSFHRRLAKTSENRAKAVGQWLRQLADSPQASLEGAKRAVAWFERHLRGLEDRAGEMRDQLKAKLIHFEHALRTGPATEGFTSRLGLGGRKQEDPDEELKTYALLRLQDVVLRGVVRFAKAVDAECGRTSEQFKDLYRELGLLADQFTLPEPVDALASEPAGRLDAIHLAMASALHVLLPRLAGELDAFLQREVFAGNSGLCGVMDGNVDLRGAVPATMRKAARSLALKALAEIDVARLLLGPQDKPAGSAIIKQLLDDAAPKLLTDCGGSRRLLILLSQGSDEARLKKLLREELKLEATIVREDDGDLVLCWQAEQISLARAAATLIHNRPDLAAISSRIRTRIDVDWTPFVDFTAEQQ